jgi:hypothetical protein
MRKQIRSWAVPVGALVVIGLLMVGPLGEAGARAGGDKATCLSKLEQPPHDIKAAMLNPHKTEIMIEAFYSNVEGCDGWDRLGKFRVQLKQRGQWRDLNGNFWYPTDSDKGGKNEAHGFCFGDFETGDGVREEREHGHWQPARVRFINFVKNVKTRKIVAQGKIKDHPVTLGYSGPC